MHFTQVNRLACHQFTPSRTFQKIALSFLPRLDLSAWRLQKQPRGLFLVCRLRRFFSSGGLAMTINRFGKLGGQAVSRVADAAIATRNARKATNFGRRKDRSIGASH
jgi:hypothetical protein